MPKFASKTQRIEVGNGQFISVLFIIPVIVDICGDRFDIYILVYINFLNRSILIFPKECIVLKPKEQRLMKVEVPFIDEILGLAIIKILDKNIQNTVILKLKFT